MYKKKLQSAKLLGLFFVLLCSFENLDLFCFVYFFKLCVCFYVVVVLILDLLVQVT